MRHTLTVASSLYLKYVTSLNAIAEKMKNKTLQIAYIPELLWLYSFSFSNKTI